MGKGAIPDRWLNYIPISERIEGTRFIAFKVPLRKIINERVEAESIRLDPEMLMSKIPNLGLIIDLTATTKYYNPDVFIDAGLQYVKLQIPGHGKVPHVQHVNRFKALVMNYLAENSNNDNLVGVHCTHGLNRTGFLICNYMISVLNMQLDEALDKFQNARGHKIERLNYIQSLGDLSLKPNIELTNWRLRPDNQHMGTAASKSKYNRKVNYGCETFRGEQEAVRKSNWDGAAPEQRRTQTPSNRYNYTYRVEPKVVHHNIDRNDRRDVQQPEMRAFRSAATATITNWREQNAEHRTHYTEQRAVNRNPPRFQRLAEQYQQRYAERADDFAHGFNRPEKSHKRSFNNVNDVSPGDNWYKHAAEFALNMDHDSIAAPKPKREELSSVRSTEFNWRLRPAEGPHFTNFSERSSKPTKVEFNYERRINDERSSSKRRAITNDNEISQYQKHKRSRRH